MGIRIDGTSDLINATDGSLTIEGQSINTTGIVTAASLVTADKIIHNGDTNTAIRFPAADTFSVETGGSERSRVTSTGNLLVGATAVEDWDGSRDHRIQVRGNTYQTAGISILDTQNDDNSGELVIGKSRGTGNTIVGSADDIGQIRFAANDGAGFHSIAWVRASMDGTPGSDDLPSNLRFGTSADGGATVSERLRITSAGRVGINETSPDNMLHVRNDNSAAAKIGGEGGSAYYMEIGQLANSGSPGFNATGSTTSMLFQLNGTEKFRLDSSGRLLLGTTNVGASGVDDLIVNVASGNGGISIRTGAANNGNLFFSDGTRLYGDHMNDRGAELQYEGSQHNMLGLHRNTSDHGAPAMTFSASRGTSAGSATVVQDDDYLGMMVFKGADGSDLAAGAYITGIVDGTPGAGDMPTRLALWTSADGSESPSERVRVDSSGRMIIARSGTAGDLNSHDAALHVTAPTDGGQGGIYIHCNSQSAGTAAAHYGLKIDAVNCANNANPQCGAIINVVQQYTASETGIKMSVEGSYNTTTCYEANLTKNLAAVTNGYSYYSNIVTTGSGGNAYHFRGQDDGALAIYILENGNIQNANNSYGSTSDLKLKENIVDASSQWNDIKNVKVRKFNFKTKPSETFIGVVAQEMETTSAGLVHTENDIEVNEATGEGTITGTTKSVKYSILYMKAIKALQEAMTRIETLETKVAALESA